MQAGVFAPLSPRERAEIIDPEIEYLFRGLAVRIRQSENPEETAKNLRGKGSKRGRKARYEERDFKLAVKVDRYILRRRPPGEWPGEWQGKTFEEAVEKIADSDNLEVDRLRKIVLAQRKKYSKFGIRAEAALEEIEVIKKQLTASTTSAVIITSNIPRK